MFAEESNDSPTIGNRKIYSRSVSLNLNDRLPTTSSISRPHKSSKARACLPPLQPLAITRTNIEEWPKPGSDDLGIWNGPPTPGLKPRSLTPRERSQPPPLEFEFQKDKLAFFNKECSRIVDYIYLGSDAVAKNREVLRKNGITHVLNCVGFLCPEYFKDDLVYKTLWLQDSPSEDITSILYDVFDYFEDVREQGGRVFVHCCQGVSRSTSLVIAYLMWKEGHIFEDAFQLVKVARGVANPNMGFACQLLQCQKRVHAQPASPSSVLRMYKMAPHSPYDPLHLVPKLLGEPGTKRLDSRGAFIVHVPSAIYIWIGKYCVSVMSNKARAAALQVVKYERAQGQVSVIQEGDEPPGFWNVLENKGSDIISGAVYHPRVGGRTVCEYDLDFELFHKAIAGGVVPPFPVPGSVSETCLPARENGWCRLRQKFACGMIKNLITGSKLSCDDPFSPSSPPFASSSDRTAMNYASEEEEHTTSFLTGPSFSPSPSFSSLDSFSCSSYVAKQNLDSASSPSNSDYSSSFTFSPSSSNWFDLASLSSQPFPSPSGLESKDLKKTACLLCEQTSPKGVDASGGRSSCFKCREKKLPSLAERRWNSPPPPMMMLPSIEDASSRVKLSRSRYFPKPDVEDEMMVQVEENQPSREWCTDKSGEESISDNEMQDVVSGACKVPKEANYYME